MFTIRPALSRDITQILPLYRKVVRQGGFGGLSIAAREQDISPTFITSLFNQAAEDGLQLVIDHPNLPRQIIAEIHCWRQKPAFLHHVFGDLIIVVDPEFQGKGLGTLLLQNLLMNVQTHHLDILRVELSVFASNQAAIALYQKSGFIIEGRASKKFHLITGQFENEFSMCWFNPKFSLTLQ